MVLPKYTRDYGLVAQTFLSVRLSPQLRNVAPTGMSVPPPTILPSALKSDTLSLARHT